ncbi:3-hydroxyacyl-CoA dehydrogenase family protein [Natronomonas salsuginis]|uniref:3-hydroxyacyl-CoA dehydrogenase family protein n=1 Tax=Natronomonas salsuginis TaxID=2217661 RepID=A0A4U5J9K2_9EURY|nr:3-hydroxyacyl-CoA dehydrogenase family protein [Natronomonas salsuginis]TKR25175.1 3-hydroxyacyl-CoA dehydrogenase family protein [Natronomonas salsuginis]
MNVTVLGAGSMGHGIAQVSAMAGNEVVVRDIEQDIVDDGLAAIENNLDGAIERDMIDDAEKSEIIDRLTGTTDLEAAVRDADLVIEAAPENMELKKDIFTDVDEYAPADAIIGTNTSSLSVTELVSVLDDPTRAIGIHFFNPAHIMELVEIIVAEQTADQTLEFAKEYTESIKKVGVVVNDFPGFSSSRLGAIQAAESIRMVQEGVATPEGIDTSMELGYNHPMGPLTLADHTGLDVNLEVLQYLREELGERFKPPQLLKKKVRAGKLGRKTGEGFYVYEDGEKVGMSDE